MDHPHYQVTAALIVDGGRIMIAQRRSGASHGGLWEFPGGKREPGETLEQCIRREIREELDIDIVVGQKFCEVDQTYASFSITLIVFLCRASDESPKPVGVDDIRWVPLDELNGYHFTPADIKVIELLRERGLPSF